MKFRYTLIIILALLIENTAAQIIFEKLLHMNYSDLPLELRVENSGVYLISSFNIQDDGVWLNAFDSPERVLIKDNVVQQVSSGETSFSKPYFYKRSDRFYGVEGKITNEKNESIDISVKNRNELEIQIALQDTKRNLSIDFPSNLAYADLIGVDKNGNIFLIVELYTCEIPLKVERHIFTLSPTGEVLSNICLPSWKYLYVLNDLQIDADGNLYCLISEMAEMFIYKVTGLTKKISGLDGFPDFSVEGKHFNDLVPVDEPAPLLSLQKDEHDNLSAAVSRLSALRTGDSYVLYKYTCSEKNLAPIETTAPDGDLIKTPVWLINGVNAKVPYKWGGFNTLSDFANGLKNGRFAGDINTKGVSSYAVGVDCSGFVSRCWNLSYHCTTRDMPGITYLYQNWDQLRPGDAILKTGHVRMYIDRTKNGAFRTVEASARDWGVSYWTYTPSDLTSYSPRVLDGMMSEYSIKQPLLEKVVQISDNSAEISWSGDTTKIKGFRLYKSTDGLNWSMIKDTNALKGTSVTITLVNQAEYFRLAAVQDSLSAESNWSNVLGISNVSSSKKALIIDGFERETGGWRGNGNIFAMKYGKALQELQMSFDMIRNKKLSDSTINLQTYDMVFWILGDESTADETFSAAEQKLLAEYLEKGGKVLVSGSEVGWDLYAKGSAEDKSFLNNYLKAGYVKDDALAVLVSGSAGSIFEGISFTFGQTYEIASPDEIYAMGGSTICLRYTNNKTAGIQYSGKFGGSEIPGKIIFIAFPIETTANDTTFNKLISKSVAFFTSEIVNTEKENSIPDKFSLSQNYPNPFNPETNIDFSVGEEGIVSLKVFNLLGEEVATLINDFRKAGSYSAKFDAGSLTSGIYYYVLRTTNYSSTLKMILLK